MECRLQTDVWSRRTAAADEMQLLTDCCCRWTAAVDGWETEMQFRSSESPKHFSFISSSRDFCLQLSSLRLKVKTGQIQIFAPSFWQFWTNSCQSFQAVFEQLKVSFVPPIHRWVSSPFVHLPVIFEGPVVFHDLIQRKQHHQQLPQVFVQCLRRRPVRKVATFGLDSYENLETHLEVNPRRLDDFWCNPSI